MRQVLATCCDSFGSKPGVRGQQSRKLCRQIRHSYRPRTCRRAPNKRWLHSRRPELHRRRSEPRSCRPELHIRAKPGEVHLFAIDLDLICRAGGNRPGQIGIDGRETRQLKPLVEKQNNARCRGGSWEHADDPYDQRSANHSYRSATSQRRNPLHLQALDVASERGGLNGLRQARLSRSSQQEDCLPSVEGPSERRGT